MFCAETEKFLRDRKILPPIAESGRLTKFAPENNSKRKKPAAPRKLRPLNDPDLPPVPEPSPHDKKSPLTVVCWDITMSGDTLADDILALGAFCPAITPAKNGQSSGDAPTEPLHVYIRRKKTNSSLKLDEIGGLARDAEMTERAGLTVMQGWLEAVSSATGRSGILLLSYNAIPAKLPRLILAIKRHRMVDDLFQSRSTSLFSLSVVRGFCDVNSRLLRGDANPLSLDELSQEILCEEFPDVEPAGMAAEQLYRLLCVYFERDVLTARISPLPKFSWSSDCILRFTEWRLRTDHMANELRAIVTTKVGRGVKRKRALIKNLIAIGYGYQRLSRDVTALGEYAFRDLVTNKLRYMKRTRQCALTETRDVGATTVLESVLHHFRELRKDRAARIAPLALLQ